jgi:hypothetical protein
MKSAKLAALVALFSLPAHAVPVQLGCFVELTGVGEETIKLETVSEVFDSSFPNFVKLPLGPYTLSAGVAREKPYGSSSMEATLSMTLFKGNPDQGQINSVRVQGLDLANRREKIPLNLFDLQFLDFTYQGKAVSRVDYRCGIVRP